MGEIRGKGESRQKELPLGFARFAHIARQVRRQRRVPLAFRRMGAEGQRIHDADILTMTI